MKAMVLAAGLGERLRPLTELLAKPVLPVLNRPLLHWTLERLRRAGVREVVVNLHHLPDTVVAALGDGRRLGLRVRYSREPELLGTGGGPRQARRLLGDEPLLIVNGDVLFDFDLRRLLARHRRSGALATLALRANPDPLRYGPVVTDRRGRILSIKAQPAEARGTVSLFTGVQVVAPALFERLAAGRSDSVDDLYIPLLAEGAHLQGLRVAGFWHDLGRPGPYRRAQLWLLRRRGRPGRRTLAHPSARLHRDARAEGSVLGARTRLAAGARVSASVLWCDVQVGAGAQVRGSILASGVSVPPGERWSSVLAVCREGRVERRPLERA